MSAFSDSQMRRKRNDNETGSRFAAHTPERHSTQRGKVMYQYRLGVRCKFCGQPIVLNDTPPGMLETSTRAGQTRSLQCVSCKRRASYALDAFHVFETTEISSGDWEAVPDRWLGAAVRAHQ